MKESNENPYGESVWTSDGDNACYTTHWENANDMSKEYKSKMK